MNSIELPNGVRLEAGNENDLLNAVEKLGFDINSDEYVRCYGRLYKVSDMTAVEIRGVICTTLYQKALDLARVAGLEFIDNVDHLTDDRTIQLLLEAYQNAL